MRDEKDEEGEGKEEEDEGQEAGEEGKAGHGLSSPAGRQ